MGEVWLAHDETLDRRVALKFPTADRLPHGAIGDHLRREARAVAALEHPSICRVFELSEFARHTFIAMEYVEGETMAARLRRGLVPLAQALSWGSAIAAPSKRLTARGSCTRTSNRPTS